MERVSIKTVERSFIDKVFDVLPRRYKTAYNSLSEREKLSITEIRIRACMPCSFTFCGKNIPMIDEEKNAVIESSYSEIENIIIKMCEGSLYAFSEHIKNGYIPFMGTRVGLTGLACFENGEIRSFINFSSLSIRVPKFLKDAARELVDYVSFAGIDNALGILVISPPGCGKTTFLRSFASIVADYDGMARRVCVVDEREELYCENLFKECYCDFISGVSKSKSIEIATRTMSPQIIVCDEIGNESEAEMLYKAYSGGIYLAASVHGNSISDICRRKYLKRLIDIGAFRTAYVLNRQRDKIIGEIVSLEDLPG